MYCSKCGCTIDDDSSICPRCGCSLQDIPGDAPVAKEIQEFEGRSTGFEDLGSPGVVPDVKYVPAKPLGNWVIGFVMAYVVIQVLAIGLDISLLNYAQNTTRGFPPIQDELVEFWLRVFAVSVLRSIVALGGIIFLMFWVNRVVSNLGAMGVSLFSVTPSWAVGWWFIPFANLVMPGSIMHDIWVASDPVTTCGADWRIGRGSGMIWFWWIITVFSVILGIFTGFGTGSENPDVLMATSRLRLILDISRVISGFLLMYIISGINERQVEKAAVNAIYPPLS